LDKLHKVLNNKNIPQLKQRFFLVDSQNYGKSLSFKDIFDNQNQSVLEIGCGRGELISGMSEANPQTNYLGVELSLKRIASILRNLDINQNSNVRIINSKVDINFLSLIPDFSLQKVIILHPDPWPKKKHHKNRLINQTFLEMLSNKLTGSGQVLISTDDHNYAQVIMECFAANDQYKSQYEHGFTRAPFWPELPTHFEVKMIKKGFYPYYMKYLVFNH